MNLKMNFLGNLYETVLNTKYVSSNDKQFGKCPLSLKTYDYSVTKITMLTSIVLAAASAFLFLFNIIVGIIKVVDGCLYLK